MRGARGNILYKASSGSWKILPITWELPIRGLFVQELVYEMAGLGKRQRWGLVGVERKLYVCVVRVCECSSMLDTCTINILLLQDNKLMCLGVCFCFHMPLILQRINNPKKPVIVNFSFEITNIKEERKRMVLIIMFWIVLYICQELPFLFLNFKRLRNIDGVSLSSGYFLGYSLEFWESLCNRMELG